MLKCIKLEATICILASVLSISCNFSVSFTLCQITYACTLLRSDKVSIISIFAFTSVEMQYTLDRNVGVQKNYWNIEWWKSNMFNQ